MQRFRLTWTGGLVPSHTRVTTFRTVFIIYICYCIYNYALSTFLHSYILNGQNYDTAYWIASYMLDAAGFLFAFWAAFALYKTRKLVRQTYSIPEQYCSYEDCLLSVFCPWCTGEFASLLL